MLGYFVGSCRLQCALEHSEHPFFNKNRLYQLGREYSTKQVCELLEILEGDETVTMKNTKCGIEGKTFDFWVNAELAREAFEKFSFFVIEISSIKTPLTGDGKTLHCQMPYKLNTVVDTEEETAEYFDRIMKVIGNRPVLFVSHFMHDKIPNRERIWAEMKRVAASHDKCEACRPSDLWAGDFIAKRRYVMSDGTHYFKTAYRAIARYLDGNIRHLLHTG